MHNVANVVLEIGPTPFPIPGLPKGIPRPGCTYLNHQLIESGLVGLIEPSKGNERMDKALTLDVPKDVNFLMKEAEVMRKWVYWATGGMY